MALKQRARREEDKQARRDAILEVAAHLLGRGQFSNITMAEVARRCGLAKGTLYLYFRSKEELFLAALEGQLAGWFDDLSRKLAQTTELDPESFGRLVAQSLAARETLTDLLAILHTVLERNIDSETALAFNQMLRDKLLASGRTLEAVLPQLGPGHGPKMLMRIHALVVGLRQMADPSPTVAEALARDDLAVLRVDFEAELACTIRDLLRGMQTRAANDPPAAASL
jgi:AcrR family transcriptional regulator